jgi:hypothetical protein
MGKRLKDNNQRIVQRCIGFNFRQVCFFNKYPDFKPDEFCRKAIDEQIKLIDPEFNKNEEKIN